MAQLFAPRGFKNARREFLSQIRQKRECVICFNLIDEDIRGAVKVMMNLPDRHGMKTPE